MPFLTHRRPLLCAMAFLGWGTLALAQGDDFRASVCNRLTLSQTSNSSSAFSASPKGLSGIQATLIDTAGRKVATQVTGKAGSFRFRKIHAGRYTLVLSGKGFKSASRAVVLQEEEDVSRWYYLDPISLVPASSPKQKKSKPASDPYATWAKGFSAAAMDARFWQEGNDTATTLGRFFNAEDTTTDYRKLWYSLLWLELEAQSRSLETRARLVHALLAALPKEHDLTFVTHYLEIAPDSLAAFTKALKAMALNRPLDTKAKRAAPPRASDLKTFRVPRAFGLELAIEVVSSNLPLPKRKALVAKLKGVFGAEGNRRLAEALKLSAPPARAAQSAMPKTSPPAEAIWALIQEATKNNAVAQFHWAQRKFEQGNWREAETWLAQAAETRHEDDAVLRLKTRLSLRKGDTASAFEAYSALARSESQAAQALGERGMGELNYALGRLDLAEQAYWRSLGLDAKSPEAQAAIYTLSAIALEKDSPNSVEPLLDTLAKLHPKDARPHFWLGKFALKNKQDGLAASHFQQAVKLSPREPAYAEALADLQAAKEEWPAVYSTLKPSRQKLSAHGLELFIEALLHTARNGEAVAESERLYGLRPAAQTLARLAQALTTTKQAAKAIALIQKSSFQGDSAVRIALALAKIENGAGAEANALLRPLVEANPTDPILHLHLGRGLFAIRDYRRASDEFGEALRFRDDVPEALYHKGLCLVKLGSAVESHYYFTELIDRESSTWKAKGHLGRGQAFAAEGKPEAAEEQLRQALALESSSEAAAHLAMALLKQDKKAEAETWARKARSLDKNSALATLALSDILLETGREEAGLTLTETDLEAHPRSCEHLIAAAKANFKAGLDDRSKEISETALKSCPGEPGPHFFLGAISARSGAKQEAKGHFEAYLEEGGDAQNLPRGFR